MRQSKDDLTYHLTSHLRLNAVYWGFTALYILGKPDALDREEMIEFVMSCWDEEAGNHSIYFVVLCLPYPASKSSESKELQVYQFTSDIPSSGAFGAHPDHDAHLLSTLSAIQILVMQDALDRMDVDRVVRCESHPPLSFLSLLMTQTYSHPIPSNTIWYLRR